MTADGRPSCTPFPSQRPSWARSRARTWRCRIDDAFGEQHHFPEDRHDMREQFGPDGGKPIDQRFQMPNRSYVIRKEIAGFLSQRFRDVDEILDVQPALFRLQSGEVCGRDGDRSRHIRLAATPGFPKMPEDAAIHEVNDCTTLAKWTTPLPDIATAAVTPTQRTSGLLWSFFTESGRDPQTRRTRSSRPGRPSSTPPAVRPSSNGTDISTAATLIEFPGIRRQVASRFPSFPSADAASREYARVSSAPKKTIWAE